MVSFGFSRMLSVYQLICALGFLFSVVLFDWLVSWHGLIVVALIYLLCVMNFFVPLFYVVRNWRSERAGSLLIDAYAASNSPFFTRVSHRLDAKTYYFGWLMISFVLLPFVLYGKHVKGDVLVYIPMGFLVGLMAYCQIRSVFEIVVEVIEKGRS